MKRILAIVLSVMMVMAMAIPVMATDAEEGVEALCLIGDVNSDGRVNADDARLTLRQSVKLENFTAQQLIWADYDEDGEIRAADARSILRVAVKLDAQKSHNSEPVDGEIAATWLEKGYKGLVCADCGRPVEDDKYTDAVLEQVVAAANDWAKSAGLDSLIAGSADIANAKAEVIVNVDGIWAVEGELKAEAFDGFMTAFGDAFEQFVGDDELKIVDETVYKNGTFQNTAIKNVLFNVGAGLFFKLANLGSDLVFGTYAVSVADEEFDLTVKLAGDTANIEKVKSFAQTISEHIAATVVDGNLVIDVKAPDALVNYITNMKPENAEAALNAKTIGTGLSLVSNMNVEDAFGSQQSAINRLCAVLNSFDGFVNKVLGKVSTATVTTTGGVTVDLLKDNAVFDPEDCQTTINDTAFELLVKGVKSVMSDDLLALTVGDFANENGFYTVEVYVEVDMSNVGDMVSSTIAETIYVNIHIFDDVDLG